MASRNFQSTLATRRAALIGALGPVLLSACGGGSSDPAPPPSITQQPVNATVTAGSAATFSVSLANSAGASYQWLRNGVEIAGATGSSYGVAPVSLLDSGAAISVRVSNSGGTVTSQSATLTATSVPMTLVAGVNGGNGGYVDGVGSSARFNTIGRFAADDEGNAYLAGISTIRKIAADGTVTDLAGERNTSAYDSRDGTGAAARFGQIFGLAFDRARKMLVAIEISPRYPVWGKVREITMEGVVTTRQTFSFNTYIYDDTAMAPDGTVYATGGFVREEFGLGQSLSSAVYKLPMGAEGVLFAGDPNARGFKDGPSGQNSFEVMSALAADAAGNVYVAAGNKLRKIAPDGSVTTIAGQIQESGFVDGPKAVARFTNIQSIAMHGNNILVGDGSYVRRIAPDGQVTTLAKADLASEFIYGLAVNSKGDVFANGAFWVGRFDRLVA